MMHDVLLQGGAYLKHLSAFVAFKLLDVGVVELTMLPQVCLLAKAQAASFTYERLLSSVRSHVRRKYLSGRKFLFAEFAFEAKDV